MLPDIRFVDDLTKYTAPDNSKHVWASASNDSTQALLDKGWAKTECVAAVCISWQGKDYWIRLLDSSKNIRA